MDGWDELSGSEDTQRTEKFHFLTGFRHGEKGMTLLEFDDPNHYLYKQVIDNCRTFIAIKRLVKKRWTELEDLWYEEGGNIQHGEFGKMEKKLSDLGKLVEKKKSWWILFSYWNEV